MEIHVARNNELIGVFDAGEVRRRLANGELKATDLCWRSGMREWAPLDTLDLGAGDGEESGGAPPVDGSRVERLRETLEPAPALARQSPVSGGAPLASLRRRFLAAVLDALPVFILMLSVTTSMVREVREKHTGPDGAVDAAAVEAELAERQNELPKRIMERLNGPLLIVFALLLGVNMWWLTVRGQTVGKRLAGIRIVLANDDRPPGFVRAVVIRSFLNAVFTSVGSVGALYGIADILFILRPDRRCIHDHLAGTRVVEGQPEAAREI
jgi:uncharacterized RDD family membrane protein YckC